MNGLVSMLLLLSLPGARLTPPAPRSLVEARVVHLSRKGGTWYFAQSGHAVFCFGPVMMVPQPQGGLQKVATFCQGDQTMVPLRD
jgi:hypothetical protein